MQLFCIIALYILTACFTYSVYKDLKRPPEPLRTEPERMQEEKPAPVILPTPPAIVVRPEPTPEPVEPEPIPEPEPINPAGDTMPNLETMNREQLEKIACDCLTLAGFKFNTYYYCRNKSDIELMDIIIDFFR